MKIKYEDINTISHALCYANALLEVKIEELEKKGFQHIATSYEIQKGKTKTAQKSLQKIRKELHLSDDFAYNEKFQE